MKLNLRQSRPADGQGVKIAEKSSPTTTHAATIRHDLTAPMAGGGAGAGTVISVPHSSQRAAFRLNQHTWNTMLNTTEQFVVLASDRLGHWVDEDLKQSIPPAKFELLRRRGELPLEGYTKRE